MKGGRKNLKRASEIDSFVLQTGQSIMQVVSLRGSNLIEVMDGKGEKTLALFPAKFKKSMWMKQGSFVVVDESAREEAVEAGRKVGCIVSQVLFREQLRFLQKSSDWPEIFKPEIVNSPKEDLQVVVKADNDLDSSDDDGLPPLEANTNRVKPPEFQSDSEPDSDSDCTKI